jgi:hypothetical protein
MIEEDRGDSLTIKFMRESLILFHYLFHNVSFCFFYFFVFYEICELMSLLHSRLHVKLDYRQIICICKPALPPEYKFVICIFRFVCKLISTE